MPKEYESAHIPVRVWTDARMIERGKEIFALSDENAPGFGRGMGMTAAERPVTALAGPSPHVQPGGHAGHGAANGKGARRVPGYPQDMWMPMDEEVTKPETHGLPKDWSAALGGMMTLVRVLPPDRYDEIMALVRESGATEPARSAPPPPGAGAGGHRH